ncbi:protealysin inhibitor emfourin [Paracoccus spongiarum]|uniref:Uncharacterized protein n=1 Tax=Paracoccus spongiarum TaxID=3064387 RepID=A0ABT9JD34_9RHOB|nr:protealysin inhibitor emfourin [Paracoccus sp. 2205BS29-5]MDP5307679.1 hypothetical protein [Paracoccus sp. 2205BS29-5]
MIIEIAAEGGFGGIAAASVTKRIDLDQQGARMRQEFCDAFEPDELARLASQPCTTCADRMTYRITLTDDRQQSRIFTIREDQLPPEMLDLIDQM